MHQLKDIKENQIINDLTKSFLRSSIQLNKVHETDAEIIRLENSPYDMAITIDTLSEEIKTGLYSNPYLIGWMSVMVNMSDIAAVGALPLGIVISQILPVDISTVFIEELQQGINDACIKCGAFVLGGDTNYGNELIISGCAIGFVDKQKYLKRIGCKPGDKIFISGKAGIGNAYAVQKLLLQSSKADYRFNSNDILTFNPSAKLEWRNILLKYSSSCIDTSDGVLSSLDQLMRLNNVGFEFRNDWSEAIEESSDQLFKNYNFPSWLLFAGEHGEFELLFSIPHEKVKDFLSETRQSNLNPVYLADVTDESEIKMNIYGKPQIIDSKKIRNLAFEKEFNPQKYLEKLMEIDAELRIKS